MSIDLKKLNLPDSPGIYLYYNSEKELIYVGKASSLKSRVRSYFSGLKNPRPIEFMIHEVEDIKWIVTDSVLEAIILEGEYIKKYRPKYNIEWRDDKSWNYIVITKDEYPRVETVREHEMRATQHDQLSVIPSGAKRSRGIPYSPNVKGSLSPYGGSPEGRHQLGRDDNYERKHVFGPYPGINTKATMKILRRLFSFSDCRPPLNLPLTKGERSKEIKPCFYYQIGQCLGICTGEISARDYKEKVIKPLVVFLKGGKKRLIKQLEKQMQIVSKVHDFEEASRLRDQIYSLQRIQDVALLNESFVRNDSLSISPLSRGRDGESFPSLIKRGVGRVSRLEGYDISNLGSTGMVGSMVVFDDTEPVKAEYRKFNIKTVVGQSDVDCLGEIMERRLRHVPSSVETGHAPSLQHDVWPLPNLVVIDGGLPQVHRIQKVFKDNSIKIPIVGIAKGAERKRNDFFIANSTDVFKSWVKENKSLLIRVRDEAHRFAIRFQRGKRRIN